jgi:hypothetical protein
MAAGRTFNGLAIDRLRLGNLAAAKVEDRELETHFVAAFVAAIPRALQDTRRPELQHVDEARGLGEAKVLGQRLGFETDRLEIEALIQCRLLDCRQLVGQLGQIGQALGESNRLG